MDLFPNEQNFDLDNSRQKFHHSLKEHHKISNIPKFRCEMLWNTDNIALRKFYSAPMRLPILIDWLKNEH
jgi:hypothetical protein